MIVNIEFAGNLSRTGYKLPLVFEEGTDEDAPPYGLEVMEKISCFPHDPKYAPYVSLGSFRLSLKKDSTSSFSEVLNDDDYIDPNEPLSTYGCDDGCILYLYLHLKGGGPESSNGDIRLSDQGIQLCKQITLNSYQMLEYCKELKLVLMNQGLILDTNTYQDVKSNYPLTRCLLHYIALSLPKEKAQSKYGLNLVSDYDLHHKMATDLDLNKYCEKHLQIHNMADQRYVDLKASRRRLYTYVARIRDQILLNFELPETPDKKREEAEAAASRKKAKNSKVEKTDEEIEADVTNNLMSTTTNAKKGKAGGEQYIIPTDPKLIRETLFSLEAEEVSHETALEEDNDEKGNRNDQKKRSGLLKKKERQQSSLMNDPVVVDYLASKVILLSLFVCHLFN